MKKIALLFFLAFFMSTCQKDSDTNPPPPPPDVKYIINGMVVDILTQKPVSGVAIYVNRTWWEGLTEHFVETGRSVTDSAGKFEIVRLLDCGHCILKVSDIPSEYQGTLYINGVRETSAGWHGIWDNFFGYEIAIDSYYKIELIPDTYAKIVKPVLEPGWEHDTLELSTENMCLPGDCFSGYFECSLSGRMTFPINDLQAWDNLAEPRYVIGKHVDISYKIKNVVVKKSGSFTVECAIGDTTAIELPL